MNRLLISIETTGDYTEQELIDFIIFELRGGSIDIDNPFVSEDGAEITDCDCDIY